MKVIETLVCLAQNPEGGLAVSVQVHPRRLLRFGRGSAYSKGSDLFWNSKVTSQLGIGGEATAWTSELRSG